MTKKLFSEISITQIEEVTKWIKSKLDEYTIVLFQGNLGSGKTFLIKLLAKELGVTSEISSPTYSLVNEYTTNNHEIVSHFDLYRIKSKEELFDIGIEEYFSKSKFVFVEWPDDFMDLFDNALLIKISDNGDSRDYEIIEISRDS